ncbi:orc-1, partial [Pristionchus pacificus]
TTATPRRSTRQQSVGRDEKRREGRKREEEEEESPSKVLDLNRMAIRTPSKGRAGVSASGAAAASPPPLSPRRGRTPTRAAAAAAATATPATMPKLQPYTPIAKVRIPPLVIPYAVPRVRLAKTGDGDWKSRTGKTPRTEGRPAPKLARVVPKKRDASYEPADVNVDESDEESEEEEETESEQSEEEEEEEERPRRGRSGARSGGRSCSRARAAAATPAAARPKQRGGYRLEMEDDDDDTLDLSGAPANLAAALDRLAVYRCPRGTLLCREGECAQIREFVRAAIAPSGISQACYISGVPGTGKTASVMAMVKELAGAPKCPRFVFIRVNAMYFSDPKQVFSEILYEYDKQTGADKLRRVSGPAARKRLNALFECVDRSRPPVLMLVDELDQLSTKKQELIYDVFNWSAVEQSRCSIISIANTLDFPERMLNQRICSRLGMNRIVFQPYTHEEIEAIVCAKLGGGEEAESIIDAKVIEIAARKVAAISGDLRKATDILRQAIEAAIRKGEKTLSFEQVKDTIREASETLLVKAVRTLARHQRIVFEAAVDIVLSRDVVDFSVDETMVKYEATARLAHGLEPISYWGVQRILLQLSSMGLIKFANPNEEFFHRRLRLVPAVVDATSALKIVGAHRAARLLAAAPSTTVPAQ